MSDVKKAEEATGTLRWLQWVGLAAIVVAAAVVNIYDLGDHPPGLFCDEAAMGYNSYAIAEAGIGEDGEKWPLLFWSFAGYKDPVYIYPGAAVVKLLGLTVFSTRLTSALFGVASVVVIFFLARSFAGVWVGLWSATFLAFMPWHIHFSRIAFGVTSFAFLFLLTLLLLLEYVRGRRTLPLAAISAALTPYAYAIATVFMSVFIAGFGLLYLPTLLRRWKESLIALAIGVACIYPYVHFYQTHERAWNYAQNARWFQVHVPASGPMIERARSVFDQSLAQWPQYKTSYLSFFSDEFLFQVGDHITRHSLRNHGELLPLWIETGRPIVLPVVGEITTGTLGLSVFKLLVVLGAIICLLWPDRRAKLILLWIIAYPAAAAVMKEVPSATRGFVGTGSFAVLAAIGIAGILRALWVLRFAPLVRVAQLAVAAAFVFGLFVPAVRHYLHLYWNDYPLYAAPGPGGFQYGYGPAIEYMESVRDQYDLFMITTSETNQPPIFPLFYRRLDPTKGRSPADLGYLVADPAQYGAYSMNLKILYALTRRDLHYFTDYDIVKRIVAPGGQEAFLITAIHARKRFLSEWLTLGPFPNKDMKGITRDFIPPDELSMKTVENMYGDKVSWGRIAQPFVRTSFNDFYANVGIPPPGNPEYVCAYAVTTLRANHDGEAFFEISGSDVVRIWLNGELLTTGPMTLTEKPARRPITVRRGDNALLVQTCEDIGSWYFDTRVTDAEGRDVDWIQARAALPTSLPVAPAEAEEATEPGEHDDELQLVSGFSEIVSFQHTQEGYGDYRGGDTRSWWAYSDDTNSTVIWLTAPVAAKQPTAFAFTASMGGGPAPGEVWVDGELAVQFEINQELGSHTWKEGEWELRWIQRAPVAGNSGYFILLAPRSAVHKDRPVEIRVSVGHSLEKTWFMIKGFTDTVEFEHLSAAAIAGGDTSEWQDVPSEATQEPGA